MPIDSPIRRPHTPILAQFAKYGLVGVINTLISVAIIVLGASLGVWHIAAYAVAYAVGALNGYLFNRRWTFRARGAHTTMAVRYCLVQGTALVASTGLVYAFVDVMDLNSVLGQFLAIAIAMTASFFANRRWTFADASPRELRGVVAAPHAGR